MVLSITKNDTYRKRLDNPATRADTNQNAYRIRIDWHSPKMLDYLSYDLTRPPLAAVGEGWLQ